MSWKKILLRCWWGFLTVNFFFDLLPVVFQCLYDGERHFDMDDLKGRYVKPDFTVPEEDKFAGEKTNAQEEWGDDVYSGDDLLSSTDGWLRRYRVHTFARTWYEAVTKCWYDGGRLATPGDDEEARLLGRMLKAARDRNAITNTHMKDAMHIGLNSVVSNTWSTLQGRKVEVNRFRWVVLPNNCGPTGLDCSSVLLNGRLSTHSCYERLVYVCDMLQLPKSTNEEENKYTPITSDGYEAVGSKSRYRIHTHPLSWLDAFDECEAEGGFLATPQEQDKDRLWQWIASKLPQSVRDGGVLLGLDHHFVQSRYYLSSNWVKNAIVRDKNCCILVPGAQFNSTSCDEPKPFVCEKKIPENLREEVEYKEVQGLGPYAIHTIPANWGQAVLQCLHEDATLAVPDSPEEAKVLAEMHRNCTGSVRSKFIGIWVGINDMDRDQIWRKLTGERTYASLFNEWHYVARADVPNWRCGGLKNGTFYNSYCDDQLSFICEKYNTKK